MAAIAVAAGSLIPISFHRLGVPGVFGKHPEVSRWSTGSSWTTSVATEPGESKNHVVGTQDFNAVVPSAPKEYPRCSSRCVWDESQPKCRQNRTSASPDATKRSLLQSPVPRQADGYRQEGTLIYLESIDAAPMDEPLLLSRIYMFDSRSIRRSLVS